MVLLDKLALRQTSQAPSWKVLVFNNAYETLTEPSLQLAHLKQTIS